MSNGCLGRNIPSIVGADGKPRIPEYEFHCSLEMISGDTDLKQAITLDGAVFRRLTLHLQSCIKRLATSMERSAVIKDQGALTVPLCMIPRRTKPLVRGDIRCKDTFNKKKDK